MPALPAIPASTTSMIGLSATSLIGSWAGPIELIVGLLLGVLLIEILLGSTYDVYTRTARTDTDEGV